MFILITHLFPISLDMLDYINYLNYLTLVCVYLQDGYVKSLNKYGGGAQVVRGLYISIIECRFPVLNQQWVIIIIQTKMMPWNASFQVICKEFASLFFFFIKYSVSWFPFFSCSPGLLFYPFLQCPPKLLLLRPPGQMGRSDYLQSQ